MTIKFTQNHQATIDEVVRIAESMLFASKGHPDPYNNEVEEEHDRTLHDLIEAITSNPTGER